MATTTGEEEVEYESDPEEVKRSLAMRRKEASDDEEGAGVEDDENEGVNRRAEIHSDESEGGVAGYDDEEEEEELVLEDAEEEGYDEEEEDINEEEVDELREHARIDEDQHEVDGAKSSMMRKREVDEMKNAEEAMEGHADDFVEGEEEKEKEPFAVPTAGAFYMHDDRFQENTGGGRSRWMRGGKKLWESRDDGKWGHDKFEEMNMQERQYEERKRGSRGRYRGRGRTRGQDRGYARGSSSRGGSSRTFYSNGNQNQAPKFVTRGRGPRRYETAVKHGNQAASARNKQLVNSLEKTLHTDSGVAAAAPSRKETTAVQAAKNMFASSLSSASPPFYPSGSSSNLTQKKEIQVGMEKLHLHESTSASVKNVSGMKMPASGATSVGPTQSRSQGRVAPLAGQVINQPGPNNRADSVSSPAPLHKVQKNTAQSRIQPSAQAPVTRSLPSSPPTIGEVESASEMGALVVTEKGSLQASGRGSFMSGGTQVMGAAGNLAVGHGDQNFPAFLPVMQFGGQHPGGMGLPAFGMAFPGYVAQSQHGLGNSEMTWLPVLSGAGALGAAFCSPYAAIDGPFSASSSGQPTSVGSSSKENHMNKPNNELKPSQRLELTNNEFPHQQSNPNKHPRRYSEMSFSK